MKKPKIKQYRISKLETRLKGYHKHFKGRFNLIREKLLTPTEFILWDFAYSVLADFDTSHIGYVGTFDYSQAEIAEMLGLDNSTICKALKSLINKGFIKELANGLYYVSYYVEAIERMKAKGSSDVITINHLRENSEDLLYRFRNRYPKQKIIDGIQQANTQFDEDLFGNSINT